MKMNEYVCCWDDQQCGVCCCLIQEDSNQSFVSAAMTPGPSWSAEPVASASTPSSPLLSLLLSNASKLPADAASSSPVKNPEPIGICSETAIAGDIKEVRACCSDL